MLLSSIFLISLLIQVFDIVGVSVVTGVLWSLYTSLPLKAGRTTKRYRTLQREVLLVRKEMMATSSQDEFAKWARLRRDHDKKHAELESAARENAMTKQSFEYAVGTARWLSMNGLRLLLQFWYRDIPMFWLPAGWAPKYIEWLLSFPKAPIGSISINVWSFCSSTLISIVLNATLFAISSLLRPQSTNTAQSKTGK